jgi:hypothetical protein
VSSKIPSILAINAHNKCDSKYTMKLATRVQVVEFWPIKCGRFCTRTRRKVATWLQEEEYSEFVTGLHWISLSGKGLYKFKVSAKVSAKGVCTKILQWVDEWTEDALTTSISIHSRALGALVWMETKCYCPGNIYYIEYNLHQNQQHFPEERHFQIFGTCASRFNGVQPF